MRAVQAKNISRLEEIVGLWPWSFTTYNYQQLAFCLYTRTIYYLPLYNIYTVLLWMCSSFGHLCSARKCSLKMTGLHAVTVTAVLLLYYGLLQLGVSCRLKTWTATSGGEVCLVVGIAAQQSALQALAHSVYRTDKTTSRETFCNNYT